MIAPFLKISPLNMKKLIRFVSYNIDGLPEKIDLKDLPWILKPIAWVYKLIKKTTVITINDNANKGKAIEAISKWLNEVNADIIAVQEDFNYHSELMGSLSDRYDSSTYTGGFDISKLFSNTEWLTCFPLPRFKCDGLNLITKRKGVNVTHESIIRWKKGCGYFKHGNDLLTHKGFRHYSVIVDGDVEFDMYTVHMDADFYDPEKCPDVKCDIEARKEEFKQLSDNILSRISYGINKPIIIIGDTNSTEKYEWDIENVNECLIKPINEIAFLEITEVKPYNGIDVDRAFIINNLKAPWKITDANDCHYEFVANEEIGPLSDHKALLVALTFEKNKGNQK